MASSSHHVGSARHALVVHPDLAVLSHYQETLASGGLSVHIARDLPTALLAISENDFSVAVISDRIAEPGDGWALGAVLHRLCPGAFVAVLASPNVSTLKEAINRGFTQLYDSSRSPEKIAAEILSQTLSPHDVN